MDYLHAFAGLIAVPVDRIAAVLANCCAKERNVRIRGELTRGAGPRALTFLAVGSLPAGQAELVAVLAACVVAELVVPRPAERCARRVVVVLRAPDANSVDAEAKMGEIIAVSLIVMDSRFALFSLLFRRRKVFGGL